MRDAEKEHAELQAALKTSASKLASMGAVGDESNVGLVSALINLKG